VLVRGEGQGFDLEEVGVPQAAIEIDTDHSSMTCARAFDLVTQ
jgi:hypothetical protein